MRNVRRFLMPFAVPGLVLQHAISGFAQEKPQAPAPKDTTPPAIRLLREQLKGYEGYYQNPENEDVKIRAVLIGDTLHLRPVWNDVDFRLIPVSDTVFYNLAEGGLLRQQFIFVKDSRGAFWALTPGGNIFWKKLVNYTPVEPREIAHTPVQLKVFEGTYKSETSEGDFLQLTERDNKLILKQYWNGEEIIFEPDSTLHFFSREERLLKLKFDRAADGSIQKMQAFNKETWRKTQPPPISPGLLKPFEGRYRLKEDSDDVIHVTASDSGLVLKQLWDGKEIVVRPLTESFFYNKALSYTLYFRKDKAGAVIGALALGADEFEKIKE
jgi:hypothetical protein